ncbi:MAG: PQQ-binding-like beta-propeller repeat protein [Planctomycetaceae bacterium]
MRFICIVLSIVCLTSTPTLAEDNWPEFRGPTGDGLAVDSHPPLNWSEDQNVVWKTAIHDRGWSSPVIWGDQVWVTAATEEGKQYFAVGLDRKSGKILHDIHVFDVDNPEKVPVENTYASPTPVIEEGRVYVHYGTYGTACIDTNSGEIL